MTHFKKIMTFTVALSILALTGLSHAQDKAMDPKQAEMMAKMKEYSTPNENHKVLDQLAGSWNYSMKFWMNPDAPPEESTGTADTAWTMGGRFIESNVSGTSMGQPFTGRSIMGYDNYKKQFTAIWYDNMATGMMTLSQGTYDAATKTLEQTGEFDCPIQGLMKTRWVTKFLNDKTYTFQTYMTKAGEDEALAMEIIYTKK